VISITLPIQILTIISGVLLIMVLKIISLAILTIFPRIVHVWGLKMDIKVSSLMMRNAIDPNDTICFKNTVQQYHPLDCLLVEQPQYSMRSRRDMIVLGTTVALGLMNPSPAVAGIDVSGLRAEGTSKPFPPSANDPTGTRIELAGISYTKAAMVLQMAEQTASMEGMMRASASDIQKGKTTMDRFRAGSEGQGPGVIGRNDLVKSVGVMVKNSKIDSIAPAAAITLNKIPRLLLSDIKKDMTIDEYVTVAGTYEAAREDLRKSFEQMSPEEQQEGKKMMRALRARDEEQMRMQNGK